MERDDLAEPKLQWAPSTSRCMCQGFPLICTCGKNFICKHSYSYSYSSHQLHLKCLFFGGGWLPTSLIPTVYRYS